MPLRVSCYSPSSISGRCCAVYARFQTGDLVVGEIEGGKGRLHFVKVLFHNDVKEVDP